MIGKGIVSKHLFEYFRGYIFPLKNTSIVPLISPISMAVEEFFKSPLKKAIYSEDHIYLSSSSAYSILIYLFIFGNREGGKST